MKFLFQLAFVQAILVTIFVFGGCRTSTVSSPKSPSSKKPSNKQPGKKSPQILQGDWESSGGDGVLCLNDGTETLVTLDSWEYLKEDLELKKNLNYKNYFKQNFFRLHKFEENLNPKQILDIVLNKLWIHVPLFVEKLEKIRTHIPFDRWQNNEKLPVIDDAQPVRPIPNNCRLIQIFDRKTISEKDKLPQIQLFYNQKEYSKLNSTQKAILQLHEYIYLFAKEAGQSHSNNIRKLIAFIFSSEFNLSGGDQQRAAHYAKKFRKILYNPLGEYFLYFLDEKDQDPKNSTNPLYKGIIELMTHLRRVNRECHLQKRQQGHLEKKSKQICWTQLLSNNTRHIEDLSDEANFVFISRYFYDYDNYTRNWQSELFMVPDLKSLKKHNIDFEKLLFEACQILNKRTFLDHMNIQEKAKLYCRKQGLNVSLLKEREVKHYHNCSTGFGDYSKKIHFDKSKPDSKKVAIVLKMNMKTGALDVNYFSQEFSLEPIGEKNVFFDLPYHNKKFRSQARVNIPIYNKNDLENLRFLLSQSPDEIESIRLQNTPIAKFNWSPSLRSGRVDSFDVVAECIFTEITATINSTYHY